MHLYEFHSTRQIELQVLSEDCVSNLRKKRTNKLLTSRSSAIKVIDQEPVLSFRKHLGTHVDHLRRHRIIVIAVVNLGRIFEVDLEDIVRP